MAKGKSNSSSPFKMKGSKNWYIRFTVPGEGQRTESTRTTNEKEAQKQLNAKRKKVDDGEVGSRGVTIGRLLDLYEADKRKKHQWAKSVEGYVRLHVRPAFKDLLAEKLTTEHINTFVAQKQTAEYADASINRYLEVLVRAYTIARKERVPPLIRLDPKIEMLDESYNVREGFLTREQYEALLIELPGHLQTLLVLGYHWGMRRGELVKLRWDQIDWHANSLRLEKRQTKTKQSRVAPLYGDLRKWLEAAYASRDPDCPTIVAWEPKPKAAPGKTAPVSETKTAWKSAAVRAKVPEALVHDLRRAAVRNMKLAGLGDKEAMMISGHKTTSMLHRYQIVDEQDIQRFGEKMAAYETGQKKLRAEALEKAQAAEVSREVSRASENLAGLELKNAYNM